MIGRRGLLSGFMASAAALALRETTEAKDPKSGGFGATASVSVNSGNDSGNMDLTYQENQAVITNSGGIALNQGNAAGGDVTQGAIVSGGPSADGAQATCCPPGLSQPKGCDPDTDFIRICTNNGSTEYFVPSHCIEWAFCADAHVP